MRADSLQEQMVNLCGAAREQTHPQHHQDEKYRTHFNHHDSKQTKCVRTDALATERVARGWVQPRTTCDLQAKVLKHVSASRSYLKCWGRCVAGMRAMPRSHCKHCWPTGSRASQGAPQCRVLRKARRNVACVIRFLTVTRAS